MFGGNLFKSGLGAVTTGWQLLREGSIDDIDKAAEEQPRISIIGGTPSDRNLIVEALAEGAPSSLIGHDLKDPTAVLRLKSEGDQLLVTVTGPTAPPDASPAVLNDRTPRGIVNTIGPLLMAVATERNVSIGRHMPALREVAARAVVNDTSLANAQLALFSNLPDIVPVLGPFLGGTVDMVLLTKNQLMMVYKLAAIQGRELGSFKALIAEVVPVLGSAFIWRTIARQLAGFAPFGLGIIPKVATAYAGTYAVGRTADYYFVHGVPPPKVVVKGFVDESKNVLTRVYPKIGKKPAKPAGLTKPPLSNVELAKRD